MTERVEGEQWRLEWTYPYLENRGETRFTTGPSKGDIIGRLNAAEDGYYWAGKNIAWHKRAFVTEYTDWEEV